LNIDGLVKCAIEGYGNTVGDSFILLSSELMTHHNAFFPPDSPRQDFILANVDFRRCRFVGPMFEAPRARTPVLQIAAKLCNKGRF
jgi:hypothetical protein